MAVITRSEYQCSNCRKDAPQCKCDTNYRRNSYTEWNCDRCKATVSSFSGRDTTCPNCGAQYNGSGQRLRDNWADNPSVRNSDISDLDGHEIQHAGD